VSHGNASRRYFARPPNDPRGTRSLLDVAEARAGGASEHVVTERVAASPRSVDRSPPRVSPEMGISPMAPAGRAGKDSVSCRPSRQPDRIGAAKHASAVAEDV
jgi:hypothetical protein